MNKSVLPKAQGKLPMKGLSTLLDCKSLLLWHDAMQAWCFALRYATARITFFWILSFRAWLFVEEISHSGILWQSTPQENFAACHSNKCVRVRVRARLSLSQNIHKGFNQTNGFGTCVHAYFKPGFCLFVFCAQETLPPQANTAFRATEEKTLWGDALPQWTRMPSRNTSANKIWRVTMSDVRFRLRNVGAAIPRNWECHTCITLCRITYRISRVNSYAELRPMLGLAYFVPFIVGWAAKFVVVNQPFGRRGGGF